MRVDIFLHQKPDCFVSVIEMLVGTNVPMWFAVAPVEDATRPDAAMVTPIGFEAAQKTIAKYKLDRVHIGGCAF